MLVSSTTSPSPVGPGEASVCCSSPTSTRVTLGNSRRSVPAPYPTASIRISGMSPYPSTVAARIAAPDVVGERRVVEQRPDARVGPDHARHGGLDHHPRRAQPDRLYLLELDRERLQGKRAQRGAELLELDARVEERAESHVAGDAGD